MRLAFSAVLAFAGAPACLDPNPDFEGDDTTAATASTSADGAAEASSSGGGVCEPDGYETDGMMEGMIDAGVFSLILEEAGATDHFNMFVDDVGTGELHFTVDPALRVCAYVGCETEPGMPPFCIDPATSSSLPDEGAYGCCGDGVLDLAYECPAAEGAKIHVRVLGATADCTHYDLEVATSIP